jgi:hypothetical protein
VRYPLFVFELPEGWLVRIHSPDALADHVDATDVEFDELEVYDADGCEVRLLLDAHDEITPQTTGVTDKQRLRSLLRDQPAGWESLDEAFFEDASMPDVVDAVTVEPFGARREQRGVRGFLRRLRRDGSG